MHGPKPYKLIWFLGHGWSYVRAYVVVVVVVVVVVAGGSFAESHGYPQTIYTRRVLGHGWSQTI